MNRRTITRRTDNATMTKPIFNTLTPIRRRRALRAIRSFDWKVYPFLSPAGFSFAGLQVKPDASQGQTLCV